MAAMTALPLGAAAAAAAEALTPAPLPPPISSAERLDRVAKARVLMQRNGIGAVLVEAGPSLD